MTPRERVLVGASVVAALLLGAAWSYARLDTARSGAARAADDLAECTRDASRVRAARTGHVVATHGGIRSSRSLVHPYWTSSAAPCRRSPECSRRHSPT